MLSILHISDPHHQTEVMSRLNSLVQEVDCDVVALTGDCTSSRNIQLPAEWNQWPQQLKLAVPGNHDGPGTFDTLKKWEHRTPWTKHFLSIAFLGIDSSKTWEKAIRQIDKRRGKLPPDAIALVILSHKWPEPPYDCLVGESLRDLSAGRPTLFLHGHKHPKDFSGSLWDDEALLGQFRCFRSQVYSGADRQRGLGHIIEWNGIDFECSECQGKL